MFCWSVKDGQLNFEKKVGDGGCISAGTQGSLMVSQEAQ